MSARLPARLLAAALVVLAVLAASGPSVVSAECWPPPVVGEVVDPFRPPPCPYCAGNRGLEYATADPAAVRSVAPGRVAFAGAVAGVNYVVVELANGWRLTYGRVAEILVERDHLVLTGSVVAQSGGELFFGLRIGDEHRDPAPHLGELVGVPRLIPDDGSDPRPAPPARLRCAHVASPANVR